MNLRTIGLVAAVLMAFVGATTYGQVPEPGSQAVHISVAARTGDRPGQMIANGLQRFADFQSNAFDGPNITAVAEAPDRLVLLQAELVADFMTSLNLLLLGYQQAVLAAFAPDDAGTGDLDTTGSIGSDALDDFFGDISGDG